jgi:hypothetical protein
MHAPARVGLAAVKGRFQGESGILGGPGKQAGAGGKLGLAPGKPVGSLNENP